MGNPNHDEKGRFAEGSGGGHSKPTAGDGHPASQPGGANMSGGARHVVDYSGNSDSSEGGGNQKPPRGTPKYTRDVAAANVRRQNSSSAHRQGLARRIANYQKANPGIDSKTVERLFKNGFTPQK